jgi:hypothetical protein
MRYLRVSRPSSRLVATTCLAGVAAFQTGLAAGAPWGAAAYGGGHDGVLPNQLRLISAGAAVLWAGLAMVVERGVPRAPRGRRVLLRSVAGVAGVAAVVNLASDSFPERMLWVPVTTCLAVAAWHESRSLATQSARSATVPG